MLKRWEPSTSTPPTMRDEPMCPWYLSHTHINKLIPPISHGFEFNRQQKRKIRLNPNETLPGSTGAGARHINISLTWTATAWAAVSPCRREEDVPCSESAARCWMTSSGWWCQHPLPRLLHNSWPIRVRLEHYSYLIAVRLEHFSCPIWVRIRTLPHSNHSEMRIIQPSNCGEIRTL